MVVVLQHHVHMEYPLVSLRKSSLPREWYHLLLPSRLRHRHCRHRRYWPCLHLFFQSRSCATNWHQSRREFLLHLHGGIRNDHPEIGWTEYGVVVRCRIAVAGILIDFWMPSEVAIASNSPCLCEAGIVVREG